MLKLKKRLRSLARKTLQPLRALPDTRIRSSQRGAYDESAELTAPEISSGGVTKARGGLVIVGGPKSAKVSLVAADKKIWSLKVGQTLDGLKPGRYRWRANAPGLLESTGVVTVKPDRFETLAIQLVAPASLILAGSPSRAKVTLTGPDGRKLPPAGLPSTLRNLRPGQYRIQVRKKGYETRRKSFELKAGEERRLRFRLFRLARLEVVGTPAGAKVVVVNPRIGFRNVGELPWKAKGLRSGRYELTVSRSGYQSQRRLITVVVGNDQRVNVRLVPGEEPRGKLRPLESRWWPLGQDVFPSAVP